MPADRWIATFAHPDEDRPIAVKIALFDIRLTAICDDADSMALDWSRVYYSLRQLARTAGLSIWATRLRSGRADYWLSDRAGYHDEATVRRQWSTLYNNLNAAYPRDIS